jgi:integrase/recombinase XerD
MSINPFISYLRCERGFSENTISAYSADVESFLGFAGGHLTNDLVRSHVQQQSRRGMDSSTIKRRLASLKTYLRWTGTEDNIRLANCIEAPRLRRTLPRDISQVKMERLLCQDLCIRDRAMLELMYATGARVSEVVGIRLSDLNLEDEHVILHGKGGKDRIVPIHTRAVNCLRRYLAGRAAGGFLFPSAAGTPLSRVRIFQIVQAAGTSVGLDISPHTLRHSFATHMLGGGADLRVLQELMGHADVCTTQRYLGADVARLKRVAALHPRA